MTTMHRTARFLTFLDGSGHGAAEVGDKAARLDRLLGAGYPVPTAAVLTTAAYAEAINERGLRLLVDDLNTSWLPDRTHVEAERAAIERSFLAAPLSNRFERALDRIVADLPVAGPVAVRASVVAEDLGEIRTDSHYLTITGIADRDGLNRAVRLCWASVWTPSARARRRESHMNDHHIAMAVMVQHMVEPQWSGVALSSGPAGREHLLEIQITRKHATLSGPAQFLIRKDTLETVTGGRPQPSFVEDLARLVVRVEQTCDGPQWIDWVCSSTGLSVIQVWPTQRQGDSSTVDDGFDGHPNAADTYTPHGVIEMLPGVVPPLLWTINSPMLENAFRSTFADLRAATPAHDQPIVQRFAGRAALNLTAICRVAESLPGGDPAEVERQYLGRCVSQAHQSGEQKRSSGVHLFAALHSRTVHKRIADDVELIDTAARTIAGLSVELGDLPVRKVVAYRQRIRDLAWRGYAAEVGASSAAGATYRALELLLERWLAENEAARWAQQLTRTAIDDSTLGSLRSASLATLLKDHTPSQIRAVIASDTADPRSEIAAHGPVGVRFLEDLDRVVRTMGSKSVYGDALWAEDDQWIWRRLQVMASQQHGDVAAAPDRDGYSELIAQLRRDKKWRRLRVLTGQFVDLRARWLRRQVDETTRFLGLREQAKDALLVLGGEERRIILEAARRLVCSGQLPEMSLVEYLSDAELDGMLFGSCGIERAVLERRRSIGDTCRDQGPLPDSFQGYPSADTPSMQTVDGDLQGVATSPGRATGSVRVVTSLADGVRLNRGDVLVAHSTDPAWTPLFLSACAVVLETGGPLSHASIVAREFGLPAVVSVPNATRILTDSETVTVDGSTGVVERFDVGLP